MARSPRTAGRFWPLTREECKKRKVPHQLRRVVPDRLGNSLICSLCGATLEKARKGRKAA